jgi:methylase of polypeptide subunit release factors
MNVIRPFIAKISMFLSKNGILIMEYHPKQSNKIKTILVKYGFKYFEFYQDQYKRSRYVIIKNL